MAITTRSLLVSSTLTALAASPWLSGCGLLIGLDEYEINESSGSGGDGSGGAASTGGLGGGNGGTDASCEKGCDDANDCTTDQCVDSECSHTTVDAGEECSGGVCNGLAGASKCVRCIDDRPGDNQDAGCTTGAPECRTTGTPTCTGCSAHEDCDDSNDCTEDTCSPSGECSQSALDSGDECAEGVCNGVLNAEACATCFDDQEDTGRDTGCSMDNPICDNAGEGACHACVDTASGDDVDLGCSDDAPKCIDDTCLNCVDDESGAGTDTGCSSENPVCDDGVCVGCVEDEQCSGGSVCSPFVCQSGMCVQTVLVSGTEVPLIDATLGDGSFEIAGEQETTYWADTGDEYWTITDCSAGCDGTNGSTLANHGDLLAWLGFEQNVFMGINQVFTVPEGVQTIRLRADTNFQTEDTSNMPHDTLIVSLLNEDGESLMTLESYSNLDAEATGVAWTSNGMNSTYNVSAYAGDDVWLAFESTTNATLYTEFFIDNIRLSAVCP